MHLYRMFSISLQIFLILIDKFASIDSIDLFSFQFKYLFLLFFISILYCNIKELEIRIFVE